MGLLEFIQNLNQEIQEFEEYTLQEEKKGLFIPHDEFVKIFKENRDRLIKRDFIHKKVQEYFDEVGIGEKIFQDYENNPNQATYVNRLYPLAIGKALNTYKLKLTKEEREKVPKVSTSYDQTRDQALESAKELLKIDEYKKIFDEEFKSVKKEFISKVIIDNFDDMLNKYKDDLDVTKLDEIEKQAIELDINKEKYYQPEHDYENVINQLTENEEDKKFVENLKYVNNDILFTNNPEYVNHYTELGERIAHHSQTEHDLKGFQYQENQIDENSPLKHQFELRGTRLVENKKNKASVEDLAKEFRNAPIQLSDNTKLYLKQALNKMMDMKKLDGSPLYDPNLKSEIGDKAYGFIMLKEDNVRAREIIEGLSKKDITEEEKKQLKNELNHVVEHHKQITEAYKEVIDICKKFDIPNDCPGNICSSRENYMPEFVTQNYIENAKVNGMYLLLPVIAKSGLSVDEFVDNPSNGINQYYNKIKNFAPYVDIVREKSPITFAMDSLNPSDGYDTIVTSQAANKACIMRSITIFKNVEKDNKLNQQNIYKLDLFQTSLADKISSAYQEVASHYFDKDSNNLQTFKNLLVAGKDPNVDFLTLSDNLNVTDPVTGKQIQKFDYNDYIRNKMDVNQTAKNLVDYAREAKKIKIWPINDIKTSLSATAVDVMRERDFSGTPYFDDLIRMSQTNIRDYYRQKCKTNDPNTPFYSQVLNDFNNKCSNYINDKNISLAVNEYSAMKAKYEKRYWFTKYLTSEGRCEKRAMDSMKESLERNGVPMDRVERIANREEKLFNLYDDYKKGIIAPGGNAPRAENNDSLIPGIKAKMDQILAQENNRSVSNEVDRSTNKEKNGPTNEL